MTPEAFLDVACKWALDHKERMVNDAQFHPVLREKGLSDNEIELLTATLADRGEIERLQFVGGLADFEISKPAFQRAFLKTVPRDTVNRAFDLCKAWSQPGGGDPVAARLAAELNLSEFESAMLFDHCMSCLRK